MRLHQSLLGVVQEDVCWYDHQREDIALDQGRGELEAGGGAGTGRLLAFHQL